MLGPLIVDISGPELLKREADYLRHPLVGGVILFSRNYQSKEQLCQLTKDLRSLRDPELFICVDHEGGAVQRFREEFTALPSVQSLGDLYQNKPQDALQQAQELGNIMASELKQCGVDVSFAPVLDLHKNISDVLAGGRAIAAEPADVVAVASAIMSGMHEAGMVATGKHFPGHGSVKADSHLALPVDERSYADIQQADMQVFVKLLNQLQIIMPAHIIFSEVDEDKPASLSSVWLNDILRQELGFKGMVISDCLSMAGAEEVVNSLSERITVALNAGCDMVLVCNNYDSMINLLTTLDDVVEKDLSPKIKTLRHY